MGICSKICIFLIGTAMVIGTIGAVALGLNVIPWWLYNHLFVPIFHTQPLSFWQVFGLLWLLAIVSRALFGSRTVTVEHKKKDQW